MALSLTPVAGNAKGCPDGLPYILSGVLRDAESVVMSRPLAQPGCGDARALSLDVRLSPPGFGSLHVRFASPSWLRSLP